MYPGHGILNPKETFNSAKRLNYKKRLKTYLEGLSGSRNH